ncbi:unnamed protein product [Calypogeia fissa]
MSSVQDIVASLIINSASSVALICAYAVLKNQPVNTRVYFARKAKLGLQDAGPDGPNQKNRRLGRYINLNPRSYIHIMDWIRSSLKMSEAELIEKAGLDSVVYLRMLLLGIQIFVPMMAYSFVVLVPINATDKELAHEQRKHHDFTYSSLDTITISNIRNKSSRLWAHLIAAYLYTIWTCWLLFRLYRNVVILRFAFHASEEKRPDQFTVLCRCIPEDPEETVKERVDQFFKVNHPDYYLLNSVVYNANKLSKLVEKRDYYKNRITHAENVISRALSPTRPTRKTGFWGLWGERVDKLDYYVKKRDELTEQIRNERIRVLTDPKSVMPAAFVSFENRWAAAVCSQTTQSKDSSKWLTDWAPEPRDVFWSNLPIPYLQLNSRRLISLVLLMVTIIFFLIPVSFVQSLANLDKIERNASFLKPLIRIGLVKSVLQGFLPGLSLRIFLAILPTVVQYLAVLEGHVSYSKIEKHACINYLLFMLVNVFLGNVVAGTAAEQLKLFIKSPTSIPNVLGKAIAQRATFFITYIMVDGWTNNAAELVRVKPFLLYHFKVATMVRTEEDRDRATPVGSIRYTVAVPRLGLYFLLGFVYSTISPLILPFIIIYLLAAYVVYRNQVVHAYDQKYESAGAYWPVMFTLRYEGGFRCYPLEEARAKDIKETENEPDLDKKAFLETAYMHPALKAALIGDGDMDESDSEASMGEIRSSPQAPLHSRQTTDESSSSGGSPSERRLLPSSSSPPGRPLTQSRSMSPETPASSRQGSSRNLQESFSVERESSIV